MTKTQIQEKFKGCTTERLKLYISALTDLLYSKLIAEKQPIEHKEDVRQITIIETLKQIGGG